MRSMTPRILRKSSRLLNLRTIVAWNHTSGYERHIDTETWFAPNMIAKGPDGGRSHFHRKAQVSPQRKLGQTYLQPPIFQK